MTAKLIYISTVGLLACSAAYADFTYEETSKITGGALVTMLKFAGAFSKDARKANEPINSTIAIKGNRMARKSQMIASIIDLDAETITTINFERKTYSTMTFAQMKQAMEDANKQMNKSKADNSDAANVKFDVKIKDTGQTRNINGLSTHEMIMTMTMQGTDQKSGAKGGMDISTDSWLAPSIPGYQEVREFYRRMAERLNWVPSAGGMFNRPDVSQGMAEIYKEGSKMDGVPVLQIVKMGAEVEGDNTRQQTSSSQSQSQPQSTSNTPPTSVGDAIGSALGGRFGLGRKKKQDQSSNSSSNQQASNSSPGSLLEMTIELTNYSSAPADLSLFAVPGGFKQVEPEMGNRRR
jgi:hypothetical protein